MIEEFLNVLSEIGSVSAAAKQPGLNRSTCSNWAIEAGMASTCLTNTFTELSPPAAVPELPASVTVPAPATCPCRAGEDRGSEVPRDLNAGDWQGLGRSVGTISREIKRNSHPALGSSEQISKLLIKEFPDDEQMRVSPETIYQALYFQARGGLKREVKEALRTGRTRRKQHRNPEERPQSLPGPVINISDRPAEVEDRPVPSVDPTRTRTYCCASTSPKART